MQDIIERANIDILGHIVRLEPYPSVGGLYSDQNIHTSVPLHEISDMESCMRAIRTSITQKGQKDGELYHKIFEIAVINNMTDAINLLRSSGDNETDYAMIYELDTISNRYERAVLVVGKREYLRDKAGNKDKLNFIRAKEIASLLSYSIKFKQAIKSKLGIK